MCWIGPLQRRLLSQIQPWWCAFLRVVEVSRDGRCCAVVRGLFWV